MFVKLGASAGGLASRDGAWDSVFLSLIWAILINDIGVVWVFSRQVKSPKVQDPYLSSYQALSTEVPINKVKNLKTINSTLYNPLRASQPPKSIKARPPPAQQKPHSHSPVY